MSWLTPSATASGVAVALLILSAWAISFCTAFSIGAKDIGTSGCILLIPWFTFLYTGLFVTGHDAMHGSVAPGRPRLNRAFGELALFLYGLIPYDKLYQAHTSHHCYPASHYDPDFHDGNQTHPVLWYFRFMNSYWTMRQTVGIFVIYNSLYRVMGVPEANLLVFWAIPSLLSSIQLFYFGTYLVHRQLPDTYSTPLRSNSTYWPYLLSLVTCYHFGYHREHHAFPEVPWWRLPQMKCQLTGQLAGAKPNGKVQVHQQRQCIG
ncbi:MAG: fatty acid desaturase [Phormidesmis sp.]